MEGLDLAWTLQAVAAAVATGLFAYEVVRAYMYDRRYPDDPIGEAGIVTAASLTLIAFANILTSWSAALSPDWVELRDFGGTMVRGTLLILAVYLVLKRPLSNRFKP